MKMQIYLQFSKYWTALFIATAQLSREKRLVIHKMGSIHDYSEINFLAHLFGE